MNNVKIKFKTITRSTNKEPSVLIRKAIMKLDKPGYHIIEQTPTTLSFRHNTWRLGSRSEAFRRLDGGVFNIFSEKKTITLDFYISPIFEIISILVAVFFGITKDYHIFLFVIFIAGMFVFQIVSARTTAEQMIDDISGTE